MTNRPKSQAQRQAERASANSALASVTESASGRAHSTSPAKGSRAASGFSPGSDPVRSAVPVKLIWQDPVTGEELTVTLEACPELIDGLRQDGFEQESEGDGGTAAA